MLLRITIIHIFFWIIIFLYDVFTLYALGSLDSTEVLPLVSSITSNTVFTYVYAYTLHKTQFFKKVAYQYQLLLFLLNTTIVAICVVFTNILIEQHVLDREGYASWSAYFFDFLVLLFNSGRFTLICLSGHHAYFLGRQVLEDQEEAQQLEFQFLSLQQEALKLKLKPDFLQNIFNTLEFIVNKDKMEARKLISMLSDVLRNALSYDKSEVVSLSEEVKALQQYIYLATHTWDVPMQLDYPADLMQGGATYFLPAGALLTLANFLLYKTTPPWRLVLENIEGQPFALYLYFEPLHQHIEIDFREDASLQNLQQRLQYLFGVGSSLAHLPQVPCLCLTIKGS